MVKKILLGIFLLLLFYPYLFALTKIKSFSNFDSEIWMAFANTFLQASVSSLVSMLFGFLGAMGLLSVVEKRQISFYKSICLLPSFLPTLFYVLATLELVRPFPYGFFGIILIHVLTTLGLSAVIFHSQIVSTWRSHAEIAYLEGASPLLFLRKMLWSSKNNLISVFFFFFFYFFVSFSVPLLVGHQFLTLETLSYLKLRTSGSFDQAILSSILEISTMLVIIWFYRPILSERPTEITLKQSFPLIANPIFKLLLSAPILIYFLGTVSSVFRLLWSQKIFWPENFWNLLFQSIRLSLGVGSLLICLFILISINYNQTRIQKFIFAYIPLSTILFAISFSSLKLNFTFSAILALTVLFFPSLFRYQFKEKMELLWSQYQTASLMGANMFFIFKKILFPQLKETIFFLSGLGAFWAMGDFAISRVIFGQESTMAIFIQNLAGQYRIEEAMLFEIILLLAGLVIFWCVSELKNVFN